MPKPYKISDKNSLFTCYNCGGTFQNNWTQDEAVKEFVKEFGIQPLADDADLCSICDDCHDLM